MNSSKSAKEFEAYCVRYESNFKKRWAIELARLRSLPENKGVGHAPGRDAHIPHAWAAWEMARILAHKGII